MCRFSLVVIGLAIAQSGCTERNRSPGPNAELVSLFEQDQADRRQAPGHIEWPRVSPRDEARRKRAGEIVAVGAAHAPEDFYRAAMIFQHGRGADDFRKARELALRAVELRPGYREARRLAASALDRELVHSGKPQKYGTQYRNVAGHWELYDVDPSTSDAERERWGVPTLHEALRIAVGMNAPLEPPR